MPLLCYTTHKCNEKEEYALLGLQRGNGWCEFSVRGGGSHFGAAQEKERVYILSA